MNQHSQNQRERLNFLEFRTFFAGQVSRSDITSRFGISEAAATRDLAIYRTEAPQNLEFDPSLKIYRIAKTFRRYFLEGIESNRLLHALIQGIGNDFGTPPDAFIACELPAQTQLPSAEILAAVSRAIFQKRVLQMEYVSASGNHGSREIVPFSLANTGLKWMVRGYCRRKSIFCNFVLNRIKDAQDLANSKPEAQEGKECDDEWNRMLRLEIVPHPAASPKERAMTELEFQMVNGVHVLRVRSALAGFVLRLWSVDCSEDQRLSALPLLLQNRIALHDVDSAKLAPGYSRQ